MTKFHTILMMLFITSSGSNVYASVVSKDCPRLLNMEDTQAINSIFACYDKKISQLEAKINKSGGDEANTFVVLGVEIQAKSAKLDTIRNKQSIRVTISLKNRTKDKILAILIGPAITAYDDKAVTLIGNDRHSISGMASCFFNGSFDNATKSYCKNKIKKENFRSLLPSVPINFSLTLSPQISRNDSISSNFISISLTLLIYKNNKFQKLPFSIDRIQVKR